MADNPVVIAGSLSTEELEKSINEIVNTVDIGMTDITEKFDTKLGDINTKIKTFSSSVKEMSQAMKESFDGMGGSFDALAQAIEKLSKAQKASTGNFGNGNDGSSNGSGGNTEYEEGTIGALKAQIAAIEEKIKNEKLFSQELRDQVALLKESENLLKNETTSVAQKVLNSTLQGTPKNLQDAEDKLANLKAIQEKYANTTKLSVQEQNRLSKAISQTEKQVERFRNQQPKSLNDVLGMDESSVDAISRKLKELRKIQIDPKNANEVKMLSSEYKRLIGLQNEMMGKNLTLVGSNNALARSFNYIRNRLVYALSIGALTSFTKQVYDVRAEYELLERSLGVLVGSFQKGNEVFRELSDMALKSPFTLIELGTAAKQLTAYNFAQKDVVETTRRLADISAALGVPMERLTYNLGQIRAQTVLTARDARDFANAGLPIVKTLADYYTKLEGQLVSTGDVYERMTKRMVSYEDVMQVLEEMTDEGGKFFNFQAKQAETLKVQLANLSLAWNNMLNEIGKSNQGLLSAPIKGMKLLFENWRDLDKAIIDITVTLGALKAAQIAFNLALSKGTLEQIKNVAANKKAVATDYQAIFAKQGLTKAQAKYLLATNNGVRTLRKFIAETELLNTKQYLQAKNANALTVGWYKAQVAAQGLANGVRMAAASFAALAPQMAILLGISAIVDAFQAWKEAERAAESYGNTIRRNAEENAKAIEKFLDSFNIGNAKSLSLDEQTVAWEKIREQIEESTAASNRFISVLMQIPDIGERVNIGKNMLRNLQQIHEIMSTWNDDTVKVNNGFKVLGVGADGLSEDLKDFVVAMNNGGDATQEIIGDTEALESKWRSVVSWVYSYTDNLKNVQPLNPLSYASGLGGKEKADIADAWQELQKELRKTTESLFNQLQRDKITDPFQIKEALEQTLKDMAEERNWTTQQLLTARILAEQHFREYYKTMLNGQHQDWERALGDRSAAWDAWLQYLTARHKKEFKDMANGEVSQSEWVKSERKKKYEETFEAFKKENALAANEIKNSVNDLNKLQVHIKVFYDEPKSVGEVGRDFMKRTGYWQSSKAYRDYAEGASTQGQIIDKLKKSQKELSEEIERSEKAGGEYWEKNKLDMTTRNEDLIRMIHSYNALTDAEEKEQKKGKGSGKAKDPLLDALKQEISLVEKLQGDYDKLTKAGATSSDALLAVRSAYGTTIDLLNKDMKKYGLPELNLDIITSQSPKEQLEYFKELKQQLETSGLGTLDRMKAVEGIIEKLDIKVKEYNLDKVTKGLNNELGKLKEEYELAVEFDANPELGNVFADMIGIDKEELEALPRSYDAFVKKMQERINKMFEENEVEGSFDLTKMLNKEQFDSWVKARGNKLEDNFVKALNSIRVETNKIRQNETKKQVDDWNSLLEKYAEYEYRINKIHEDAEREREIARKQGAGDDVINAITNKEKEDVEKVNFEKFQQSQEWIIATGDLAGLTDKALGLLIDRLEEYKKKAKYLSPKELRQLNGTLKTLYNNVRSRNPFKALSVTLKESKIRTEGLKKEIEKAKEELEELNKKEEKAGKLSQDDADEKENLIKKIARLGKLLNATSKEDAMQFVEAINKITEAASTAIGVITNMMKAFGAGDAAEIIGGVMDSLKSAGDMALAGAMIGGVWGAAIGGVIGLFSGLVSSLGDILSGNASITEQIEESKRKVSELENAYKNLERAVEDAYGAAKVYTQEVAIQNKRLQLQQLERQLALEESRKSKYRDEDAIISIKGQIIDLRNEIEDMQRDIVNTFLGISDAGSAVENMVEVIINALRQGENAISGFNDSVDDMIANMIKQVISARIVGPMFDKVWEDIQKNIDERVQNLRTGDLHNPTVVSALEHAQEQLAKYPTKESYYKELYGISDSREIRDIERGIKDLKSSRGKGVLYGDFIQEWEARIEEYKKMLEDAAIPTFDDIRLYGEKLREIAPELEPYIGDIDALLTELGLKKGAEQTLSNLQQGIQGVTEDTASAIEAYMNGVSQQVYLHSDLLTEIRDAVVGMNFDTQLGTIGEILLQLQNSFQTQQAIRGILEGWSNANGMAVKVEMV